MQCRSCGTELPIGVAYCPICGTVTPYKVSESGISPYDLTSASSPSGAPPQAPPPPSTDYGSPPYGMPQQNPYQAFNPYAPYPTPTPPPPPSSRRQVKFGLIIGAVVLVLVLASAGVFALFTQLAKNNPPVKTTTPTTITAITAITNLTATATPIAITATSTVNAEKIPYPPYRGTLILNDALRDNSNGYNWQETNDSSGSCEFTGGAYHARTHAGYFYPCTANNTDFDSFAYEVQMKIIKGDCGALLFRIDTSITKFYYFRVCQDGSYALFIYDHTGSTLIPSHSNSAINAGLNKSNLVAVVARGSTLDLYINQQQIDSIVDSTYSHGEIGMVADGFPGNHPTEVVYSNAKVWKL